MCASDAKVTLGGGNLASPWWGKVLDSRFALLLTADHILEVLGSRYCWLPLPRKSFYLTAGVGKTGNLDYGGVSTITLFLNFSLVLIRLGSRNI